MSSQGSVRFTPPPLEGPLPSRPEELFKLHRLCLRIYGLLTRDLETQVEALTAASGISRRRKEHKLLLGAIGEELPVLIALHALERLSRDPRLEAAGLAELVPGLLLPCFSLSYNHLYQQPSDPLSHVLARVDWYLDGDKGDPAQAFCHFLGMMLGDKLSGEDAILEHMDRTLFPELDTRLDLAFRYEYP